MPETEFSTYFYVVRSLMLGVGFLLLYQAFLNYLSLKQKTSDTKKIYSYIGLCLFSSIYCFNSYLQLFLFSIELNLALAHVAWVAGAFVSMFYMRSMSFYLEIKSKLLDVIIFVPKTLGMLSFLFLIYYLATDEILLFDNTPAQTKNIYILAIGNFAGPNLLSILFVVSLTLVNIISSFIFIVSIWKKKRTETILFIGVLVSLVAITNDSLLVALPNLFPIMFLGNLLEILRITYKTQTEAAKEIRGLRQMVIDSAGPVGIGLGLAGYTHDMANRLLAINGIIPSMRHSLQTEPADVNSALKSVDAMDRINSGLGRLFEQVTQSARQESNLKFNRVQVEEILGEALGLVEHRIEKYKIHIKLEGNLDAEVNCKDLYLVHGLVNLLTNAIDACQINTEKSWIKIEIREDQYFTHLRISNSGVAIPENIKNKIFDARFSTKTRGEGTGLGLQITKTIIDDHNGKIYLDETSRNTCFVVELPN